ncbi:MAG TPA: hypothetical protein VNX47_04720 [Nevskia sp.]|nr:hypothetical protein [Nevskia sp.]
MNLLTMILIAANAAVLACLWLRHLALRRDLDAGRRQLEQWNAAGVGALAATALTALGRPSLISVEILNPMELAVKESALAKAFGSLTPDLVRREVYKEIYRRLCVQLQEQGVVAEVRLHDGG